MPDDQTTDGETAVSEKVEALAEQLFLAYWRGACGGIYAAGPGSWPRIDEDIKAGWRAAAALVLEPARAER